MNTAPLPLAIDRRKYRVEKISTILSILLFIISLAYPAYILRKGVNTTDGTKIMSVMSPSLQQYAALYELYPETLTCTCSQPMIDYGAFIKYQYALHEVCDSVFVSQNWISSLTPPPNNSFFHNDFRVTASHSFQTLRTLCELVNNTIMNNLYQFYANQYFSLSVTPQLLVQTHILSKINQVISSMKDSFMLPFSLIRNSIHNTALLSSLQTNYRQLVQQNNIFSFPVEYQGCNCALSSQCVDQSAIYQYPSGTQLFSVPGFYTGCYVIESLLQSNLQCFYNQSCINQLTTYLSSSIPIIALDSTLTNRFFPNSTINEILDVFMIAQWQLMINYSAYFNECHPKQCSYATDTDKTGINDGLIYIVGIAFGVIGSTIAIISLIIPRLVTFFVYGLQKKEIHIVL